MDRYKAVTTDWNYGAICTLTSLPVQDLVIFKRFAFVAQRINWLCWPIFTKLSEFDPQRNVSSLYERIFFLHIQVRRIFFRGICNYKMKKCTVNFQNLAGCLSVCPNLNTAERILIKYDNDKFLFNLLTHSNIGQNRSKITDTATPVALLRAEVTLKQCGESPVRNLAHSIT